MKWEKVRPGEYVNGTFVAKLVGQGKWILSRNDEVLERGITFKSIRYKIDLYKHFVFIEGTDTYNLGYKCESADEALAKADNHWQKLSSKKKRELTVFRVVELIDSQNDIIGDVIKDYLQ